MTTKPIPIPVGAAPGVATRWQELHASGEDYGTAAPRLRELSKVELRSGPLFADRQFTGGLRERHRLLGADGESLAAIDALEAGAACVIAGQQPHLLCGPFYTAWKLWGAIALARRLEELHGRAVVPVYWCGSDDSDFAEVSSAWLFHRDRGPWRLRIPAGTWEPGAPVGAVGKGALATLEAAALDGLSGPGVEALRARLGGIPDSGLADRVAAWLLRLFTGSGLVVVDARDRHLSRAMRPILEDYTARAQDVAALVTARADERRQLGWPAALDASARRSGLFALREDRRAKLDPREFRDAADERWSPSVLLRPAVQDALLGPVAAVLGPGELAYHAEIAPVYEVLGVGAARPVARPHATLVGRRWGWPAAEDRVRRLLGGGTAAVEELTRMAVPDAATAPYDDFSDDIENALEKLELGVGGPVPARARARFAREVRRLRSAGLGGDREDFQRRSEWLARGRIPQERLYSMWLLWAWCEDPVDAVLDPLAAAWLEAVDAGGPVQWAVALEEIE